MSDYRQAKNDRYAEQYGRGEVAVEKWDEWFALTGDEQSVREWAAAKSVHAPTETGALCGWALIIESNRLDRSLDPLLDHLAESGATPPKLASEGSP